MTEFSKTNFADAALERIALMMNPQLTELEKSNIKIELMTMYEVGKIEERSRIKQELLDTIAKAFDYAVTLSAKEVKHSP